VVAEKVAGLVVSFFPANCQWLHCGKKRFMSVWKEGREHVFGKRRIPLQTLEGKGEGGEGVGVIME